MDNTEDFTHISLCTGYGGIDLGLSRVIKNFRTICYSEIEAYAVANLVTKIEKGLLDAAPIWSNLKTLPWENFCGKVDIISGGFPCQPFSQAGRKKGDEDPRHLFPYIKRGIELVRPAFVFLENVEGIISTKLGEGWADKKGTSVLLHVLRELERLGYKAEAGIFSAEEIGAPHQRRRVFILAHSNSREIQTCKDRDFIHQRGGDIQGNRETLPKVWYSRGFHTRPSGSISELWPARRGQKQFQWEPPRVVDNSLPGSVQDSYTQPQSNSKEDSIQSTTMFKDSILSREPNGDRETQSKMGGGINGDSYWMDYGRLCQSLCSRNDELMLLGNGVIPSVAEKAFRVLWERLKDS